MQLSDDNERRVKGNAMPTDYNEHKYWVEDTDLLTEAEKLEFAKGLFELERQGVIQFRGGRWQLAAGGEIEETPDGLHKNREEKEEGGA